MKIHASKPRRRVGRRRAATRSTSNLLVSIHELSNLIGRAFYGEIATQFGIGIAEWRVLLTLAHRSDATSVQIATTWSMEKMAVSRAVRRLERMRLVARRIDRRDKRRQILRLTGSGRRFYRRVLPIANARYREIISCLDHPDLASLGQLLDRLIGQTRRLAARSEDI